MKVLFTFFKKSKYWLIINDTENIILMDAAVLSKTCRSI